MDIIAESHLETIIPALDAAGIDHRQAEDGSTLWGQGWRLSVESDYHESGWALYGFNAELRPVETVDELLTAIRASNPRANRC